MHLAILEIMWISDHLNLDGRHFFRECCRSANGLWFIWVYVSFFLIYKVIYSIELVINNLTLSFSYLEALKKPRITSTLSKFIVKTRLVL